MTRVYEVDDVTYHGSVAVLFAHDALGHEVAIAAEPDLARDIDLARRHGRRPVVEAESWQILYGELRGMAR